MKNIVSYILLIISTQYTYGQGGIWVWMKGDTAANPLPNYGVQGVPNTYNVPPGLYEPAHWIDDYGDFWVFGGLKYHPIVNSETNYLWRYNPATNIWTWMKGGLTNYGTKGVSSPGNCPGPTAWCSLTWKDNQGYLWLYGGVGLNASAYGRLNTLWRYNVTANEWTWIWGDKDSVNQMPVYGTQLIEASTNTPGARAECNTTWVDADNNFWFFGGQIGPLTASSVTNDLWKFNTTTLQWTWMKGSQSLNDSGHYGIKGVEDPLNLPVARTCYTSWEDDAGNFYIFGGTNRTEDKSYNDTWKYNPKTNNWTWISGDDSALSMGLKGAKCIFSHKMHPSARGDSRAPKKAKCRNSFLMCGGCFIGKHNQLNFNDLWELNPKDASWKLLDASDMPNSEGSFGAQGVPDASNIIPALSGECLWLDADNNLWLFAGWTLTDSTRFRNAMWKFIPSGDCYQPLAIHSINQNVSANEICPGDSVVLNLTGSSTYNITPSTCYFIDSNTAVLLPETSTSYIITAQTKCNANDSSIAVIKVDEPHADFVFSPAITTLDQAQVQLINLSTEANNSSWYALQTSPNIIQNSTTFLDTGEFCYQLTVSSNVGCLDSTIKCIKILPKPFIRAPDAFTPNGDGINDYFTVFGQGINTYEISIYSRWGEVIYHSSDATELNNLYKGWGGKILNNSGATDVFFYKISYIDVINRYQEIYGSVLLVK